MSTCTTPPYVLPHHPYSLDVVVDQGQGQGLPLHSLQQTPLPAFQMALALQLGGGFPSLPDHANGTRSQDTPQDRILQSLAGFTVRFTYPIASHVTSLRLPLHTRVQRSPCWWKLASVTRVSCRPLVLRATQLAWLWKTSRRSRNRVLLLKTLSSSLPPSSKIGRSDQPTLICPMVTVSSQTQIPSRYWFALRPSTTPWSILDLGTDLIISVIASQTDTDISRGKVSWERRSQARPSDSPASLGPPTAHHDGVRDEIIFRPGIASNTSWDQFAANEQIFGVTTWLNETVYKITLGKSMADFREMEEVVQRIGKEKSGVCPPRVLCCIFKGMLTNLAE